VILQQVQKLSKDMVLSFLDTVERLAEFARGRA
jgi:hypothetical protein